MHRGWSAISRMPGRPQQPGKLSSFRAAARDASRMVSDIKDAGKTAAQTHWNATHTSSAKPAQLISETGQPLPPETFREVSNQGLNAGDAVGNSLVWAGGAAAVIAKIRKSEEDDDGREGQLPRTGQGVGDREHSGCELYERGSAR